jgi:SRSO17 transposase
MVKPRTAQKTVKFIDEYCQTYRDLFPEVRSFGSSNLVMLKSQRSLEKIEKIFNKK